MSDYELLCCIVEHNKSSKLIKIMKSCGIDSATLFYGRGTVHNKILDLLDLNDLRKEIIWMRGETAVIRKTAKTISKEMQFRKKGYGIAVCLPVGRIFGANAPQDNTSNKKTENEIMHNAIFTIVKRGRGEQVVDTATAAGARGATIWHGRGSGTNEAAATLFAMPIEPEREIVMIIADIDSSDSIIDAISTDMKLEEAGHGVLFTMPVSHIRGLR